MSLPLSGILAWTLVDPQLWTDSDAATNSSITTFAAEAATGWRPHSLSAQPPVERSADLSGRLESGETLGSLFSRRLGLTSADAQAAASSSAKFVDLRQLRAGSSWRAFLSKSGELERFELDVAERGELALERGEEWTPTFASYKREERIASIRGRLDGSFEESVVRAGAPSELAYAMAEVLQWDLDFNRDLQPGDEFRVLYEEVRVERSAPSVGRVLGVEYGRANGRTLEAYAFEGEGESGTSYYDAEGRPLQKMFLRSPLPYSRVTSRFTQKRLHPILGIVRPHLGVDYGAPTGTPVRVTASGTVVSAGWEGGGGRMIKVRHPNEYLTAYLHLSRFAAGVRSGARVRQGDVIGYVGSTGLATAPHLDYRLQKSGRWIDPLSLQSVPAQPVSPLRLVEFQTVRDAMRRSLEGGAVYETPAFDLARDAQRVAGAQPDGGAAEDGDGASRRASGAT